MQIVLAPDSFKGSITSIRASETMAEAITSIDPSIQTIIKPMADGGEGTLEALLKATTGVSVPFFCRGPLGEASESFFAEIDNQTAVIECATIAGLPLVPLGQRNPDVTTTYGIGEAILRAMDRGNKHLIIGLGGSSTNDGGLGMLQALGMKAFNADAEKVGIFGKDLLEIEAVDFGGMDPRLMEVTIQVACDVDNPLTGSNGATYVYGPQKGATNDQLQVYDQALSRYGQLIEKACNHSLANVKGAGAAGGLGFALLAIGAKLQSGAKLVADAIKLEEAIKVADLVITGEGQSDEQTLYGKAPGYVAELAAVHHKPTILLSGSLDGNVDKLNDVFAGCFSIVPGSRTLQQCMDNGELYLYNATKQLIHLIRKL
ncbi:glycerate kinase [Virgibacillus necropolis]|uniref:Glycerate kinase n=1 Tax=Virgibacillus necropolis TaxID=163877 RepID=A0A221M9L3_9BACI|nr:glycerate kinase [Virgibacillus necropolis]ASN04312.1 glycerate kinase [Virgibacillus necropolis]